MTSLSAYLPQDRLRALSQNASLPNRTTGAALFADISGFTLLTEQLDRALGTRRGIEELAMRINRVYDALVREVDGNGGSVISFAGDSITCWFDESLGEPSARAVLSARAMQDAMRQFPELSVKITVSTGPVRRLAAGDPGNFLLDTLAGATIARLASAEQLARGGEILIDRETAAVLSTAPRLARRADTGEDFFVLDRSLRLKRGKAPAPEPPDEPVRVPPPSPELLKPWILPTVYESETTGRGLFLTELRPTVALFTRFTGIDYDHDERAPDKLNAILSTALSVLAQHGGTLLQLTIGDKGSYFYASFGATHAHEDDAARAVRAAVAMRQQFQALEFLDSVQFGLSSGIMRVGSYGSSTRSAFGALGDDVNLAARFMMADTSGEILVTGRVQKALGTEFLTKARPPITVKGKAEPQPVFAVLGAQENRVIRLQEPSFTLPMMGRGREMGLLQAKLEQVLGGRGQVVGITAEAGMGKSRLVAEGLRVARWHKFTGYGGACQSNATTTPYAVWRAVWNAFFDLDPAMPLRKQVRLLERELQDRVPERMEALPLLGAVLGLDLPDNAYTTNLHPQDRKTQVEALLLECLRSAALEAAETGTGLLFCLEDLHWIDSLSLDLLDQLAGAVERLPVLVLLTYRPAEAAAESPALRLMALEHFTQVELAPLDPEETEQAIRAKLAQLYPERRAGVPRPLIERISAQAQGNPFYAEELLNSLHDRGLDPNQVTAWETLELPTSLHSLILSRIDRLAASQQLSLKVASIIGRVFSLHHLSGYYPQLGTQAQVRADLDTLARFDLTPLESAEPELTYLFKHLITHEVAYQSLSSATRAQLHGDYATYLEQTYGSQTSLHAPVLAHHFEQARVPDKARVYLELAGEQAAAGYANADALDYFTRALALTPEQEDAVRFTLLSKRERVCDLIGDRVAQRRDLAELTELADRFEDAPVRRAGIATRRAQLEIDVGEFTAAIAQTQAAARELESSAGQGKAAPEMLADAFLLEARAMFLAGEVAAAKPRLEHALELARTHHYGRGEYNALAQLGVWHWHSGDYHTADGLLTESLEKIRRAGDLRRELEVLNNLGIVAKARSRFAQAVGFYEQAQIIARKMGDRSGEAALLNNMGSASLAAGDFAAAGRYAGQAADLAVEIKDPTLQGMALTNRGEAFRELGQYQQARGTGQEALKLLRASGYKRGEAVVLDNLGMVELAEGHFEQALELLTTAVELARALGFRATEAGALLHCGQVHTALNQFDAAAQALETARCMALELDNTVTRFETDAAMANLELARSGNSQAAFETIEELAAALLQEPPPDIASLLPLSAYVTAIQILQARSDPRAPQLIARARAELDARSEKIKEPEAQHAFLSVPAHHALAELVHAQR